MPGPAPAHALQLDTPLRYLPGVGPRLAPLLEARGLSRVEDLLYYLPFRYEDRSLRAQINQLQPGIAANVVVQTQNFGLLRTRNGMQMAKLKATDATGVITAIWYNAGYLRGRIQPGQWLALYGTPEAESGNWHMRQPEFELLSETAAREAMTPQRRDASLRLGRIVPVYESLAGNQLSSGRIRLLISRALAGLPAELPENLPDSIRARLHLVSRREAFEQAHFPRDGSALAELNQSRGAGHCRLIFEELFFLQLGLEIKRQRVMRQPGIPIHPSLAIREKLKQILPFHPTADQKQALKEIVQDMSSGRPMRRLLQGDVGSGKTLVALEAAVLAMENGYSTALMAPTQILASQHYLVARERLPGYAVELITSQTRRNGKAKKTEAPAHAPRLWIGTQALLHERAGPHFSPALVMVDEQHRFGVLQRFQLLRQGERVPHLLVMTATPIPRTLALALYGDFETSTLRQRPPGKMPVTTRIATTQRAAELYEILRQHAESGRQAYVVCPVIEESENSALYPALEMEKTLREALPEISVGLLHGRLEISEKSAVMQRFQAGEIQILVSTTVIEVGVDVPNATLMVIQQAERFGMAQLHQLRGRIGRPQPRGTSPRAGEAAVCLLRTSPDLNPNAQARLEAVQKHDDGFALAELDLKMRGPGEFFGTRQSGLPAFRIAQPIRDQKFLELARVEARDWWTQADAASRRGMIAYMRAHWQRSYGLIEAG